MLRIAAARRAAWIRTGCPIHHHRGLHDSSRRKMWAPFPHEPGQPHDAARRGREQHGRGDPGGARGSHFLRYRRHPVLQSTETQMLDTLTSHRDPDDFNTVPGGWPYPGGFLPEARTGAREAAARMKDLAERFAEPAERHHAPARQSVPRRTRRAPPSASPFGEHAHEREGQPRRRRHRHHGRERRSYLTTHGASARAQNLSGQNRAMPPNTPACLDQRSREFEEGKEKGDASKGKESSLT